MTKPPRDTLAILKHLVRMQQAGLPWLQSLHMWHESRRHQADRLRAQTLIDDMRAGFSLTDALARGGWLTPPLQALSRAGEASGTWAEQLGQWLTRAEHQATLSRQIHAALAYPVLILVLALLVLAGVLHGVLPVFEGLYRSLSAELPWVTRSLLAVRDGALVWGGAALTAAIVVAGLVSLGQRQPRWRLQIDLMFWRLPLLGTWRQMQTEAQWCALLGQLLQAGIDWSSALALLGPTVGSPTLALVTWEVGRSLTQGQNLAASMVACNLRWRSRCGRDPFSLTLVQWVQAGETAGTLPKMLAQWSAVQSANLTEQWGLATRLLEPLLMALLGLWMGWLVLALYLPVMQMGQWI